MVKAYLRYEHAGVFGVISSNSNVLYDAGGKQLITGALENISFWNVRQGSQAAILSPEIASSSTSSKVAAEVTQIALSPSNNQLAAGYSDGSVRLWDVNGRSCLVTLSGHSGAVTALCYSSNGALLASGSADTSVIVWDVVGESGLCRFKGHKDAVTDLALVHQGNKLISCSKDGCIKVWDVLLQHCSQTLTGFKGEVWSLAVNPDETRLVAGCVDSDLRVYAIRAPEDIQGSAAAAAAAGASLQGRQHADADGDDHREQQVIDAMMAAAAGSDGAAQQQQQQRQQSGSSHHDVLLFIGNVRRTGQERVSLIRYDHSGQHLGVMGAGKGLEVFKVRSGEEAVKKMKRRKKRRKEKQQHKAAKTADGPAPGQQHQQHISEDDEAGGVGGDGSRVSVQASDEVGSMLVITIKHKLKSFCFNPAGGGKGCLGQIALGLSNNSVEVIDFKESAYDTTSKIDLAGHRSDVRCLALSGDDTQLLSGSNSGCKLWDPVSGACLGSIDSGYALCCVYAPGNRHALVGTKEGFIQLVDVGACSVIHTAQAHTGPVWSLALLPDKSGFVSGSADKTIKFWTWAVTEVTQGAADNEAAAGGTKKKRKKGDEPDATTAAATGVVRQLGFKETRVLDMSDDVLCVRVSPDGKLLAASLLDATIKVYYVDSLKFFLSLYGHKLPALSMDISSDSTLLVTGSADKNIKVWGLDFGDCHKSMFAHQDTITAVAFVRDTHYAFSVSKDRMLKYWDLDRFEMLLELPGHHGEVWALALAAYGDYIITGSHDRSLRRWERTSEPFFVEEEKERRLESLFEADLEQQQQRTAREGAGQLTLGPEGATFGAAAAGAEDGTVASAGRRTIESVSAADSIIDALDVAAHEQEKEQEYQEALRAAQAAAGSSNSKKKAPAALPKRPPPNPLMLGQVADAYVLRAVSSVRANDLEQALLLLPFSDALRLLQWVCGWLNGGAQVELGCRVATLLLRLHHAQLTATPSARQTLVDLHKRMRAAVQGLKDTLGFNIAALKYLQRLVKANAGVDDADIVQAARRALLADGVAGL